MLWVPNVTDFRALKGQTQVGHMQSAAPSGLDIHDKPQTQGVALGWHNIAPLGLKPQKAPLQNLDVELVISEQSGS